MHRSSTPPLPSAPSSPTSTNPTSPSFVPLYNPAEPDMANALSSYLAHKARGSSNGSFTAPSNRSASPVELPGGGRRRRAKRERTPPMGGPAQASAQPNMAARQPALVATGLAVDKALRSRNRSTAVVEGGWNSQGSATESDRDAPLARRGATRGRSASKARGGRRGAVQSNGRKRARQAGEGGKVEPPTTPPHRPPKRPKAVHAGRGGRGGRAGAAEVKEESDDDAGGEEEQDELEEEGPVSPSDIAYVSAVNAAAAAAQAVSFGAPRLGGDVHAPPIGFTGDEPDWPGNPPGLGGAAFGVGAGGVGGVGVGGLSAGGVRLDQVDGAAQTGQLPAWQIRGQVVWRDQTSVHEEDGAGTQLVRLATVNARLPDTLDPKRPVRMWIGGTKVQGKMYKTLKNAKQFLVDQRNIAGGRWRCEECNKNFCRQQRLDSHNATRHNLPVGEADFASFFAPAGGEVVLGARMTVQGQTRMVTGLQGPPEGLGVAGVRMDDEAAVALATWGDVGGR
ncbi:hypothetical protein M427DRAFT_154030 [Gonapodya prolifera JEL478]|uniref:C2H2-type domain-containing protein n=1 Tax=Gonapodya prolifera (strain JEL478) TaxID=1344416 RepID=A0A139AL60_GONPJ|nr:hypothetical protein M427DRAFT_154030 [Gonapodya prolifera JEL478]|eukprot:KXS17243.1 hypothetical protein M427DRAFT_154030 [Gonapodya prolifera JEL478]